MPQLSILTASLMVMPMKMRTTRNAGKKNQAKIKKYDIEVSDKKDEKSQASEEVSEEKKMQSGPGTTQEEEKEKKNDNMLLGMGVGLAFPIVLILMLIIMSKS